jgi:streptogramin lyase
MRDPVSLGVPLADVLLLGGTVAPGPGGRPALWNVSTGKPAYLNAIDPVTGEQLVSAPLTGADGSWAVTASSDGVYAGTYGPNAHLYRWRPGAGNVAEDLGLPLAGQTFIWALTSDADGMIWGGTFPGGKVFRFDPSTKAFKDFGQVVAGQTYVRSIAFANGKVYSGSYAAAHIAELDPATGTVTELPKPPGLSSIEGKAVYDLDAFGGRLYARIGSDLPSPLFVYDLAARAWTDEIPDVHGLEVSPPDADGGIYFVQLGQLRRYDPATKQLTDTGLTLTGKVQNTRSIGWAELGLAAYPGRSVVGTLWRGEMFRYNPTTGAHAMVETKVRKEPIEILSLGGGGRRTVYAGGFLNGGLGSVRTDTGVSTFHRFAQIESILQASDGTVWIGVYPESRLYRYWPGKPWNSPEYSPGGPPGTTPNPQLILNLGPKLQARSKCLAEVDGKIAVGTVPAGDRLGGGLAIYDPSTTDWQFTRNVSQDQSLFALAAYGGVVYGGGSVTGGLSTTPPTRRVGAVFAWDVNRAQKLWEIEPVSTEGTVSALAVGPDGKLWGLAGHTLFAVDRRTKQILHVFELGTRSNGGSIVVSRSKLYVSVDGGLVYRIDPFAPHRDPVLIVSHPHRRLTGHQDGRLYFNRVSELFVVEPRN